MIQQVRALLRARDRGPDWRTARASIDRLREAEVEDELFPPEQARIVQLLGERVDVSPDGVDIRLRTEGLANLVTELRAINPRIPEGGVMTEPNVTGDG